MYAAGDSELGVEENQLPADWQSDPSHESQLAVCQYDDDSHSGFEVGTCPYQDSDGTMTTAKVSSARYVFRVFAADTGALINQFTLTGSTSAEESCPATTVGSASEFFQKVSPNDVITALRPIVEGNEP